MSCKRKVPVFPVSTGRRLRSWVELVLLVAILSEILYATPIIDAGEWHADSTRRSASYASLSEKGKTTLQLIRGSSAIHLAGQQSQAASTCIFASNCPNPVHIPESAALAFLGTGLLSIAGLLRRRLTR